MLRSIALAVLICGASMVQAEEEHSFWWRTRAKAACITDVVRLCGSSMPDEGKVAECMKTKKSQVSEACASFYPGGENAE